jgi:S-formylglutathione hydrolase FrmB
MPQVHRSFYTDEAHGGRYWTFLSEELPELVGSLFRVSDRREDTFVAGLSMGGYGAVKWALRHPHRFAAAASLSGALDVAGMRTGRRRPEDPALVQRVWGEGTVAGGPDDLMALIRETDTASMPDLGIWCGTEDVVYEDNVDFRNACTAAGVPLEVDFGPGAHDWAYWDATIQDVLAWLPLRAGG